VLFSLLYWVKREHGVKVLRGFREECQLYQWLMGHGNKQVWGWERHKFDRKQKSSSAFRMLEVFPLL
jgi:hypothetical protein